MISIDQLKPIAFHCYTSTTRSRIFEVDYSSQSEEGAEIMFFEQELIDMFNENGIKTIFDGRMMKDNKIVFEVDFQGTKIYYGFYDWRFSIGLSCYDEHVKDSI